jgi:hypothetical protein
MRRRIEVFQGIVNTSFFFLDYVFSSLPLPDMKIATNTQSHKVTQKVLLKINPWCLRAFVAKKINYKEMSHVINTCFCLIHDFESTGTRRNRRKVYGPNGTINFKTASGNGNGKRFFHYKKINGITPPFHLFIRQNVTK